MKYVEKRFTVSVTGARKETEAEYERIFGKRKAREADEGTKNEQPDVETP